MSVFLFIERSANFGGSLHRREGIVNERRAAQVFERESGSIRPCSQTGVPADQSDLGKSIELAGQLRALGGEWRNVTPHGLQQAVLRIADRAAVGIPEASEPAPRRRKRALSVSFAATAAAVLLIIAIPAARDSVARQFHRALDVVRIGPDTEVVQPDASTAGEIGATLQQHERELASGRRWSIHTAYGGFGGSVPPGASPALQRVDRLELLRSMTSMAIQLPTSEYRGAIPRFSHALVAPDGLVFVFLGSGDRELLVVQAPVGGGRGMSYSRVIGGTDKQGRFFQHGSELRTEELRLGNQSVIWDPDTTGLIPNSSALRWEGEGISYSLMGRALTKDEAAQLFLSLRRTDTQGAK